MTTNERGLAVIEGNDIVRPAVTVAQALAEWKEYQDMKAALATPDDQQEIQGRMMLKKSYWRKVGRFYKLDTELLKEWHEDREDGTRIFYATYRAIHSKSGAFCDGDGLDFASDINEFHNARATAHTRAKNRAISDLVGGGEVSAEEASGGGRGAPREPDKTSHYCATHNANWFKRGSMSGYAHPKDCGGWCNESASEPGTVAHAQRPEVIENKPAPHVDPKTGAISPAASTTVPFDAQRVAAAMRDIAPGLVVAGKTAANIAAYVGKPWPALEALGADGVIEAVKKRKEELVKAEYQSPFPDETAGK